MGGGGGGGLGECSREGSGEEEKVAQMSDDELLGSVGRGGGEGSDRVESFGGSRVVVRIVVRGESHGRRVLGRVAMGSGWWVGGDGEGSGGEASGGDRRHVEWW